MDDLTTLNFFLFQSSESQSALPCLAAALATARVEARPWCAPTQPGVQTTQVGFAHLCGKVSAVVESAIPQEQVALGLGGAKGRAPAWKRGGR